MVIFTPFCRIETGKAADGAEVSQRRKSGDEFDTAKGSKDVTQIDDGEGVAPSALVHLEVAVKGGAKLSRQSSAVGRQTLAGGGSPRGDGGNARKSVLPPRQSDATNASRGSKSIALDEPSAGTTQAPTQAATTVARKSMIRIADPLNQPPQPKPFGQD